MLDPRQVDLHAAVAELGSYALRSTDLAEVFATACHTLCAALECPSAGILRMDPEHRALEVVGGHGLPPGVAVPASWPVQDGGIVETAWRTGRVVCLNGSANDQLATPEAMRASGFRSAMAVPIRVPRGPWGILSVASPQPGQFVGIDADFIVNVANVVAASVERSLADQQVLHQSLHDPLTGLPNRALLFDRIAQAQNRAQRGRTTFGLMLIDIDDFKDVNDAYGHACGDSVLQDVASRLLGAIRPADTIARLGGDEFVLLCEGVDTPAAADGVVRRLQSALESAYVLASTAVEVGLHASIGVTFGSVHSDAMSLLREADAAMYAAKRAGGNQSAFYSEGLRQDARSRMLDLVDLRRALDEGELVVHYQPVVDLCRDTIVAVEALVRWQHPQHGLVGADRVVPAAERTGLIAEVGRWVRRAAMAQVAIWQGKQGPDETPLRLAVNVSSRELARSSVVDQLLADLDDSRLRPGTVDLELTESTLLARSAESARTAGRLRTAGARVFLDDFGTGYSSLTMLRELPIDGLKIDRSFTAGLPDTGHVAIVQAVVTLADALGLDVVAEGVETAEQRDLVRTLGCRHAQGFFWAPALPSDDLGLRLDAQRRVT